jgi:hypothetical protein
LHVACQDVLQRTYLPTCASEHAVRALCSLGARDETRHTFTLVQVHPGLGLGLGLERECTYVPTYLPR